jgi:N-acetylglucosaminyldiphosphoundecaprenol N-acetyl-beta-D-mannosaminyltransferase
MRAWIGHPLHGESTHVEGIDTRRADLASIDIAASPDGISIADPPRSTSWGEGAVVARGTAQLMSFVIFGVRLDELDTIDELRTVLTGFLDGDRASRVFTPNPEILLRARGDAGYAGVLRSADLALPDGTGVAFVRMLTGRRSVRRWPGVEIAALALRLAADRGETVAFVGSAPDVAERAATRWRALPGLKVVVAGAGVAFGDDGLARPPDAEDATVEVIRSAAPTVVLVGLGAPKQERWIDRHADAFPSARAVIGVGGAFDMWAGAKRRAPRAFRTLGLEWLWRLALEPRRWPRTLRATVVFPVLALLDRSD